MGVCEPKKVAILFHLKVAPPVMSQLHLEELFSSPDDTHDSPERPTSPPSVVRTPVGLGGALWEIGDFSLDRSRPLPRRAHNWALHPLSITCEARARPSYTFLRLAHRETTPAPGQTMSGICQSIEDQLAEEGLFTSLREARLWRLVVTCDCLLPFPAPACHVALSWLGQSKSAVRWSVRVLHCGRSQEDAMRCRAAVCMSGYEVISRLLWHTDTLETLWHHLLKHHPPTFALVNQGQATAPIWGLQLASNGEAAAVVRSLLLGIGLWESPAWVPRRMPGQLPDEARLWDIEDERRARIREQLSEQDNVECA